jgi:predicted GNAT family acetyltransferase
VEAVEVRHNAPAGRFEATVGGQLCVAEYHVVGDVMRVHHTEVPPSLGNRGIAGRLVRAAFDYADAHALKVEPWCGYVRGYMKRHPDTLRFLPAGFPPLR